MPPIDDPSPPDGSYQEQEHPDLVTAQARVGLQLFGIYTFIYAGFVGLNAFAPKVMAWTPFGGLNVAILYGMGLIATAFLLAMVYMALCKRFAGRYSSGGDR